LSKVVYFEKPGRSNTARTLKAAHERAEELGLRSVVVASTTGETGLEAARVFKGFNVVVVSHVTGFAEPNVQQLTEERRAEIIAQGGKVVTVTHAFGGAGRAVRRKFGTVQADELMANVLKLFGEGVKVAVEVALMAADAGLVRVDEEVVAIGGTGGGCDSALILSPANVHNLFDLRVHEVICKPRLTRRV
ncbi:MAG: pyruvate kinase alpha/beta domain-containing protein, partial [Candidatus Bathyarchaeia archaeon]